jgi:hypothetical protein
MIVTGETNLYSELSMITKIREVHDHNLHFVLLIEKTRKDLFFTNSSDFFSFELNGCTKKNKDVCHIIKTSLFDLELSMKLRYRSSPPWTILMISNQTVHKSFKRYLG